MSTPTKRSAKGPDLRHPIAKARDAYMEGANCDSTTLGARSTDNIYLRNRIEAAFIAGWNAGHATPTKKTKAL